MGLDKVADYGAILSRIRDDSIWPPGEEGNIAKATILSGVSLATQRAKTDAERLAAATSFLKALAVSMSKIAL